MFVLTSISALFYTPIFFAAESMYVDMRNNETNTDDLIMACRCTYTNDQLNNFNQLFLLAVKGSNVFFALVVYSCIFTMSIFTKRPAMSKGNKNIFMRILAYAITARKNGKNHLGPPR
jgi:hypothetical protein